MNIKTLNLKNLSTSIGKPTIPVFFIAFFLISIADGIMGYIFPIVVEQSVGSNTVMGIIMALSSITGLICDFVFPSLISKKNWKQLLVICVGLAFLFPIFSYFGEIFKFSGFFIIATIMWGLYYEFLAFSQQNYIVEKDKARNFSKDWGLLAVLISIMEVITPILGSSLLVLGGLNYPMFVLIMLSMALMILLNLETRQKKIIEVPIKSTSRELFELIREFRMWDVLSSRVWRVLLGSFILQCIFATYWTFGGLFGQYLVGKDGPNWIVMFLYAVPCLVASIILSKYIIKKRKKILTHLCLIIGGLLLMLIGFVEDSLVMTGFIILLSSFIFALAYPLNNAVFSDLGARLGKERNHLFGMINAIGSVSFILVPIILGFLSDKLGYYFAFAFIGGVSLLSGLILIFTTPRKIRLPQKEINALK